jgi:hypothetical protein
MRADTGYNGKPLAAYAQAVAAITVEVVARTSPRSFQVLRRRWVVERTLQLVDALPTPGPRLRAHHGELRGHDLLGIVIIMTSRLARYENGQPPTPRWGGERPRHTEQAALSRLLGAAVARCGRSRRPRQGAGRLRASL